MTTAKRILRAVTLRRVFVALLIGGFAKEILSLLPWLAGTGWELSHVATLRAFAVASAQLAFDAALIYLALRGLASALESRRGKHALIGEEAGGEVHDSAVVLGDFEAAGRDSATAWPQEGGDDGHGPDRH